MADKDELLDYLRNQQKAAEIEAKMNGVNVWVLLGAMAVIGWQLASSPAAKLWADYELLARTMVTAVAFHMLSLAIGKRARERDDLRYSAIEFGETDSPYIVFIRSLVMFLPPIALCLLGGTSVGMVIMSLLGLSLIVFSAIVVLKPLFPAPRKKERFPKPRFGMSSRADVTYFLVASIVLVDVIIEQIAHFHGIQGGISIDEAKPIVLFAVLYFLVLITLHRKQQNEGIGWTYELETDLVLGVISPEVAIRKIENRRLGPRLQDVVDRFFDDLDRRFAELDSMMVGCSEQIRAAREVPEEYPAERAVRLEKASNAVSNQIDALTADCKEFREYLAKLEQQPAAGVKAVLTPVLTSLKSRYEAYHGRARTAKMQLTRLLA